MRAARAWILAVGLVACYPADAPDARHLPSCFMHGAPRVRAGMALVRLRWVQQSDSGFRARGVEMSIDGRRALDVRDEAKLERELVDLTDIELAPGPHRLDSVVHVSGWGTGLFAYLQDYRKALSNQRAFSVEADDLSCLSVVVSYRDDLTLPIEQRPESQLVEERMGP